MSDAARLCEVVRDAAERGDDLVAALTACGLPGAAHAAERLAGGATLPQALAGLLPPRLARLLDGGVPPLATLAALAADEAWRSAERRRLVAGLIAYPLASLAVVAVLAVMLARLSPPGPWYAPLASLTLALPPAALAVVLVIAPWTPVRWRLPGAGWARQLDLAGRWARAALAVRWRLTEAQAQRLLGVDLPALGSALGMPGAEAHCRLLYHWHQRRAQWRLAVTAWTVAALILAAAGGLVLGTARLWTAAGAGW